MTYKKTFEEIKTRGNTIKKRDFVFFEELKSKGDEISLKEKNLFLEAVHSYIDKFWNELKDGKGFDKEYQYDAENIEIKKVNLLLSPKYYIFRYRESWKDKIKLKIDCKDITDGNKEGILNELVTEESDDAFNSKYTDTYKEENDDKNLFKDKEEEPESSSEEPPMKEEEVKNTQRQAKLIIEPEKDDTFIQDAVKLLIDNELTKGFTNTDESAIFDFFITQNYDKTIVKYNIDEILTKYKVLKSAIKEGMFDRLTQSVKSTESKGVVADLIWAFNSDSGQLKTDMEFILKKWASLFEVEAGKVRYMSENIQTTKPDSLRKIILNIATGGRYGKVANGLSKLKSPYVWISAVILCGGYYIWNGIDKDQKNLAIILLIMYISGSEEIKKEFKQNNISIRIPEINLDKLKTEIEK